MLIIILHHVIHVIENIIEKYCIIILILYKQQMAYYDKYALCKRLHDI